MQKRHVIIHAAGSLAFENNTVNPTIHLEKIPNIKIQNEHFILDSNIPTKPTIALRINASIFKANNPKVALDMLTKNYKELPALSSALLTQLHNFDLSPLALEWDPYLGLAAIFPKDLIVRFGFKKFDVKTKRLGLILGSKKQRIEKYREIDLDYAYKAFSTLKETK